jgi:hypothetical protein
MEVAVRCITLWRIAAIRAPASVSIRFTITDVRSLAPNSGLPNVKVASRARASIDVEEPVSDNPIRLRRHTDGRVALRTATPYVFQWFSSGPDGTRWLTDEDVFNPDWSELLVAELPEPDGHIEMDGAPYWNGSDDMPSFVAYQDGVETEVGEIVSAGLLRAEALKMLAAVAACERLGRQASADVR